MPSEKKPYNTKLEDDCIVKKISINYTKILPLFHNSGSISGDEPSSMVCKISGHTKRKFNLIARLIIFLSGGEDASNRHETAFYQQVAPHLTDTTFKFPKVFFAGM